MKDKNENKRKYTIGNLILASVIGCLIGAILMTGGYLIYRQINPINKFESMKNFDPSQMKGGFKQRNNSGTEEGMDGMPEIPNGDMPDGEEPPELPYGEIPNGSFSPDNNSNKKDKKSNNNNNLNNNKQNNATTSSKDA